MILTAPGCLLNSVHGNGPKQVAANRIKYLQFTAWKFIEHKETKIIAGTKKNKQT